MATVEQETADAGQVEHVDMTIASDANWGDLTPDQQAASITKAVEQVNRRHGIEPEKKPGERVRDEKGRFTKQEQTSVAGDESSAGDDAAQAVVEGTPETEAASEGEQAKETSPAEEDWRDEATREFATMMGLSEEDLADFGSREELDRTLRILNRRAIEAGKAAKTAQGQTPSQQNGKQSAQTASQQPVQQSEQEQGDPFADLGKFKLDEQYDQEPFKPVHAFIEAAANEFREFRKLRDEVAAIRQDLHRSAAIQLRRHALQVLHTLGMTELFGKPGEKLTKEQAANFEKVFETHRVHVLGTIERAKALGIALEDKDVGPTPQFLKAAVFLEFGDQLLKQQREQQLEKLRKQSATRTGGAAGKRIPQLPPENETQREKAERIAADPDLRRFHTDFQG